MRLDKDNHAEKRARTVRREREQTGRQRERPKEKGAQPHLGPQPGNKWRKVRGHVKARTNPQGSWGNNYLVLLSMILKASWEEDQKLHPWILKNTRALGIWLHCLLRVFQLRSEAELRGDWHECVGWLIAQSGAHSDGWSSNQTPLMELTNSAHKGDQHKCCLNLRVAYYQPAGLTILFTIFVSTDHEAFSNNSISLFSSKGTHCVKRAWTACRYKGSQCLSWFRLHSLQC